VEDAALLQLSKQQQALQVWQQQLNPKGKQQLRTEPSKPSGSSTHVQPAAPAPALPALAAQSAEEAVLTLCGITPDVAAQAYAAAFSGADGSAAAAATAAFRAALAPKPAPRAATAAEQAAVEADTFGVKARVLNADAGARWLMQWCQRATGQRDDTIATAVCRMLLSNRRDDEMAAELFDLLGDSVFEHIGGWAAVRLSWRLRTQHRTPPFVCCVCG
jgi:hypothetical protein